jgi:hypothetical protein
LFLAILYHKMSVGAVLFSYFNFKELLVLVL